MENISDFLNKFKSLIVKKQLLNKDISNIIFEVTKLEISPKNISLINGVLFLKINPIQKNSVFIKKQEILKRLEKELNLSVSNIR